MLLFNFRPILFVVGIFLLVLGVAMVLPAAVDFAQDDPNAQNFVGSFFVCCFTGGIFILAYRHEGVIDLRVRETFLLTAVSWIIVALFASLPFVLSQSVNSLSAGILEAVSAITTTGFTVLKALDHAPDGILLWRAILQWLGGLGIILMALTLLPFLRIGGMQLFYTEFSDHGEKVFPKVSQITRSLLAVYFTMTATCTLLLQWGGFSFFDALCCSMSTVSTSGMRFADKVLPAFETPFVMGILSVFMILAASPLLLLVRMLMGDWSAYFKDAQVRTYLLFFMISAGGVCLWLFFSEGLSLGVSLSQGFFRTSSIISTTGFQGTHTWTPPLMVLSVILSIIGGCTGSTAGGIKVFRIQILYRVIRAQMYKLLHPHGVFAPVYNKRNVADQVIYAVFSLFAVYVISIGFFSLSFTLCGLSAITSLDLTINILSNSGFSYTASDLAAFSQPVQWLLILGMLLGRLEFMTLLVIALPPFWKR